MNDNPWNYEQVYPHFRAQSTSCLNNHRSMKPSKPRASMACRYCRQRKVRCDAASPSCSLCSRLNKKCEYVKVTQAENAILREKKRVGRAKKAALLQQRKQASRPGSSRFYSYPPLTGQYIRPHFLSRPPSSGSGVLPVLLRPQKTTEYRDMSIPQIDFQRQQMRSYYEQQQQPSYLYSVEPTAGSSTHLFHVPAASSSTSNNIMAYRPTTNISPEWSAADLTGASGYQQQTYTDRHERLYLDYQPKQHTLEEDLERRYRNARAADTSASVEYEESPFGTASTSLPAVLDRNQASYAFNYGDRFRNIEGERNRTWDLVGNPSITPPYTDNSSPLNQTSLEVSPLRNFENLVQVNDYSAWNENAENRPVLPPLNNHLGFDPSKRQNLYSFES